jgi:thiamine-monophosphate kinase
MSGEVPLGPGAEFDAIRQLVERWGTRARGIGDDAAVLDVPRGDKLVVSVDAAVENRHFRAEWLTARDIGYRAVVAALSDLAAMAARPLGVLVAFEISNRWRSELLELADGVGDAVDVAGTQVVGGNITGGERLSITTTVLGSARSTLARSAGRVGDGLYVTGQLGAAGQALARLAAGREANEFRDRFARPVPRLAEARWLADRGATAAIDISDGLVADLRHLARASGVAIDLDAAGVPCFPGVDVEQALSSGEEYELVVASPVILDTAAFSSRFQLPLSAIGRMIAGPAGDVSIAGARVANVSGHDHLSR